ncbi:tRNA(Arg) A34 adenosine deaminase TadA [Arthrobacter sp. SLBN-122]|nr:tRNA(Arg) A34 adenosine deaminase TadA [Arthrobacter sp. SLBN-122]
MIDEPQASAATPAASDPAFEAAYQAAQKSLAEGGIPIGAALARDGVVIASGHNERVQNGDPIAHGEMSALRAAGRQKSYRDTTLYTTLAPCAMCTGTIIQFKIPRVVVGEARTFDGEFDLLRSRGVEVVVLDDPRCVEMMRAFQEDNPDLWAEDIAEDAAGRPRRKGRRRRRGRCRRRPFRWAAFLRDRQAVAGGVGESCRWCATRWMNSTVSRSVSARVVGSLCTSCRTPGKTRVRTSAWPESARRLAT